MSAVTAGAIVAAPEWCGQGRARFVCPYHSWTYEDRGMLIGRPHKADLVHAPRDAASLVLLPVAPRCGLAWEYMLVSALIRQRRSPKNRRIR